MASWIEGWIELTSFPLSQRDDEYSWQSAIDLNPLIDTADSVSEQLFGISRRLLAGEFAIQSFFANRGLPPNPSPQVETERETIRQFERRYGSGDFSGYTHATWREIKAALSTINSPQDSDWNVVFAMVHQLEESQRFSDDQIRFVVWFNW